METFEIILRVLRKALGYTLFIICLIQYLKNDRQPSNIEVLLIILLILK